MKVIFSSCEVVDNRIFGFSKTTNMLCETDKVSGTTTILGSLPGESLFVWNLISRIICHDGTLYLVPFNAKKIWLYNIGTKKFKSIDIYGENIKGKFTIGIVDGKNIILIGGNYPDNVILDTGNNTIVYSKWIINNSNNKDDIAFKNYALKDENKYLFPSCRDTKLYEFDMEERKLKEYLIKTEGVISFDMIMKINDEYWITPRRGNRIICWDGEKNVKQIKTPLNWAHCFCGVGMIDLDNIIFVSSAPCTAIKYNVEKGTAEIQKEGSIEFIQEIENGYIYQYSNGTLVINKNGAKKHIKILINIKEIRDKNCYFKIAEKNLINLEDYISII